MIIHHLRLALIPLLIGTSALSGFAEGTNTNMSRSTNMAPSWLTQPLSLADALNQALRQNGTILRAKSDLEAQYGVVVQTLAIALPRLQALGNYQYTKEVQTIPFPGVGVPNNFWNASIQLTQTIYQGGQINSALRSAKLTKQQALFNIKP